MPEEVTIESQRIYDGRVVRLRRDTVRLAGGRVTSREIVEHPGSVAIVALDGNGDLLLIRQFRKAVERYLLEIPAGTLEPDEDPVSCAQRELREETGYQAGQMELMVSFYSCPGFCTEWMHIYLASDLRPAPLATEEDEAIEVVKMSPPQALRLMATGEICDGKTIVGLLALEARLAARR